MNTFIVKLDGAEVARISGEGLEFAQRNGADDPKMVRLQRRGHSILVVVCSTQENVIIERCADAQ